MQTIFTSGMTSSAHVYGNVASAIKEFLLSNFPRDYFKDVTISSEIANKQLKTKQINSLVEHIKKVKPYMTIKPTYEISNKDIFLANTLVTSNLSNTQHGVSEKQLHRFFRDKEQNLFLSYKMNRDKINYEVNLYLKTAQQKLDVYKMLQNLLAWDTSFSMRTSLESLIPRSMVKYLGKLQNIDLDDKYSIPTMAAYLNSNSIFPVTYKMRNSTSKEEFFMYYSANIIATLYDLEKDEGTKKNMVDDYHLVTFTISAEFNLPVVYYLIGDDSIRYTDLALDLVVNTHDEVYDIIPIFTINNLYSDPALVEPEFKLLSSSLFKVDKGKSKQKDILELNELFNRDTHEIIRNHISAGIPISTFIKIKLIKTKYLMQQVADVTELDNPENREKDIWAIDWNRSELHFNNADPEATYRIVIFVNNEYLNKQISNNIEKDLPNIDKGLQPKDNYL